MDTVWNILLLIGVFALIFAVPIAITMCEKRLVWPYAPPMDSHGVIDHDGYGERTLARALEHDFEFLGWCDDVKGRIYKVSYAFLISPDGTTLAVIGIGNIMKMPLASTWLHTPGDDGQHSWISCDHETAVEADPMRLWTTRLVRTRGFPQLLESHQRWLASKMTGEPLGFPEGDELNEFHRLRRDRYDRMAAAGYIRYVDGATATGVPTPPNRWRYTVRGATKVIFRTVLTQFAGMIPWRM